MKQIIQVQKMRYVRNGLIFLMALLLVGLFATMASAQSFDVINQNIHYFQPPSDGSGLINAWGSEPIGHLGFHFGVYGDYAFQPLEWTDPKGQTHILIYSQLGTQYQVGFGLFEVINISGTYAMTPQREFNQEYMDKGISSVTEDARVDVKYIFRNRRYDKWGLAAAFELTLPIGDEDQYVSDEMMTYAPRLIFDIGNTWWSYVANVGYKYYPQTPDPGQFNTATGDELLLDTGVTFRLFWGLETIGELQSHTLIEDPYGQSAGSYAEGIVGLRSTVFVDNPLSIMVGMGFGMLDGVGTSVPRYMFGLKWFMREIGKPR